MKDLIAVTDLVILLKLIQIVIFSAHVTLKFDGWPWKTTGCLFYITSNFVHHFKGISVFKLELQSGNAQFGSKLAFFVLCDLEIWWITLENKRVTFLYHIKLYVSFQTHRWIQIGVTIRKHPIWVKIWDFFVPCDFEFDGWAKKTTGQLFYTMLRFAHHFKTMVEFKLELQSRNN